MPLPFPPGPGQATAVCYPGRASASGPIHLFDGVTQSGDGTATIDEGTAQMWHSCGLCDWSAWVYWDEFTPPTLPFDAGSILGIYPVCEAKAVDLSVFNISCELGAGPNALDPNAVSPGALTVFAPPAETDYVTINGASLGTSLSLIAAASIYGRFFQTLSLHTPTELPPYPTLSILNPRLVVYYGAPVMPVGHAANCNGYDPIIVADGATTPPGNGTLISI